MELLYNYEKKKDLEFIKKKSQKHWDVWYLEKYLSVYFLEVKNECWCI